MSEEKEPPVEVKEAEEAPKGPAEPIPGTMPMMMSMSQMEKYDLKTGPRLIDTKPFHLFNYAEVMAEILKIGFYSPFHEFSAALQKYTESEILIVADPQEVYGQNWYVVLDPKLKDEMVERVRSEADAAAKAEADRIAAIEAEAKRKADEEYALANAVYEDKPVMSRTWEPCTGADGGSTEMEMEQTVVKMNRPLVRMKISRKRKEFGLKSKFSDRDAEQGGLFEFRQHKDPNFESSKTLLDVGLQACPSWTEKWLPLERQQRARDGQAMPPPGGNIVLEAPPLPPGSDAPLSISFGPALSPVGAVRSEDISEGVRLCSASTQTDFFRARNNSTQFEGTSTVEEGDVTTSTSKSKAAAAAAAAAAAPEEGAGAGGLPIAAASSNKEKEAPKNATQALVEFLSSVGGVCEIALQQNEVVDIFEVEMGNLGSDDLTFGNKGETGLPELRTFTDLVYSKNKVLPNVDWHPIAPNVVAVSCVQNLTFQQKSAIAGSARTAQTLIWSFADLIHPQLVLESPHETPQFKYNPSNPNLIAAGCSTGQVLLWDLTQASSRLRRKLAKADGAPSESKEVESKEEKEGGAVAAVSAGAAAASDAPAAESVEEDNSADMGGNGNDTVPPVKPKVISSIDLSHRRPVSDLTWLPAAIEINHRGEVIQNKTGEINQFMTVSTDGQVLLWDLRYKDQAKRRQKTTAHDSKAPVEVPWNPLFKLSLTKLDGVGELGLCKFSLGGHKSSTALYVGTEEGQMCLADWAGSRGGDDGDSKELVKWIAQDHFRPCQALLRSPFFSDVLLTVGDWSFNLWREGVRGPIFSSPLASTYLTSAAWSPSRPGVVLVAKSDGTLDVWDLTDQSHKPSFIAPVASSAVTSLSFRTAGSSSQQLLGVGDAHGNLHILDMPRSLKKAQPGEEAYMRSLFERETRRVQAQLKAGATAPPPVSLAAAAAAGAADGGGASSSRVGAGEDGAAIGEGVAEREAAERAAAKEEEEYRRLERRFRHELGMDIQDDDDMLLEEKALPPAEVDAEAGGEDMQE